MSINFSDDRYVKQTVFSVRRRQGTRNYYRSDGRTPIKNLSSSRNDADESERLGVAKCRGVETGIDIKNFTGDTTCQVGAHEGGSITYFINGNVAP